jgi:hypothetical protein
MVTRFDLLAKRPWPTTASATAPAISAPSA